MFSKNRTQSHTAKPGRPDYSTSRCFTFERLATLTLSGTSGVSQSTVAIFVLPRSLIAVTVPLAFGRSPVVVEVD